MRMQGKRSVSLINRHPSVIARSGQQDEHSMTDLAGAQCDRSPKAPRKPGDGDQRSVKYARTASCTRRNRSPPSFLPPYQRVTIIT